MLLVIVKFSSLIVFARDRLNFYTNSKDHTCED